MLLLLPARRVLESEAVFNHLSVSLRQIGKPAPETHTEPISPEPPPPVNPEPSPAALPSPAPAASAPPVPAPRETVAEPEPTVSAARLLDYVYQMRASPAADDASRALGEPAPMAPGRPLTALGRSNALAGDPAPAASIEILDRWLAADGSRNVLIRTPSGDLLCGRAEAWDPLNPLVEPVIMYRDCGSAGPTFEWPDRYRAGASHPR